MILDSLNWRTLGAAIVWLSNSVALAVHILTYGVIEQWVSKLIYGYSCFFTLVYIVWQILKGFSSDNHKGFIILSLSSLSVFFIFIILQFQFGVSDYKWKIGVFLLTELITISCVVISGLKHGLFNNAKDML